MFVKKFFTLIKLCKVENVTEIRANTVDFKNVGQKFTKLGLTKGRGWFLNFLGAPMILKMQKVYLLRLMLFCDGLTMVSCLFLSVPLITSGV